MNNEEQILTILTQIQEEQKNTNQRLQSLEQGQANLEQGQAKLENEVQSVKDITIRIENNHGDKLNALFDAHKLNIDFSQSAEPRITKLEKDVDYLSIQVGYLKAAK